MADGYQNAGEHKFADLDEWLCEYVDGTIDPVVCQALEEYMQHNPELASHVERLRETRHLLCQYGCSYQAPSGLQPRLRRRLATEIVHESEPFLGSTTMHLMTLATVTSVVAMILIFASPDDTASNNVVLLQEGAVTLEQLPPTSTPMYPSQRATPVNTLMSNEHFSRFAQQPPGFQRTYLAPSLFPMSALTQTSRSPLQPAAAESFTAP